MKRSVCQKEKGTNNSLKKKNFNTMSEHCKQYLEKIQTESTHCKRYHDWFKSLVDINKNAPGYYENVLSDLLLKSIYQRHSQECLQEKMYCTLFDAYVIK